MFLWKLCKFSKERDSIWQNAASGSESEINKFRSAKMSVIRAVFETIIEFLYILLVGEEVVLYPQTKGVKQKYS